MLTKPQETSQGSVKEHRNDTERSFGIIGRPKNTTRRSALDLLRRIGADVHWRVKLVVSAKEL